MKIAGIVLAGGQSLRMGEDKATLTLEQSTLLTRSVNLLHSVGLKDCYVSGDYEGYDCIKDLHQDLGPIAGISACVKQLNKQYDAIFIIPVDMPLLTIDNCQCLLTYFKTLVAAEKETVVTTGVYYKASTFPMLLSLTEPLLTYLNEVIITPYKKQRSLYRLIETLDVQPFHQENLDTLRFENTNTPEQWQRCLSIYAALQQVNK